MIQYQPDKKVKIPKKSKMLPVINATDIILLVRSGESLFTIMYGQETDSSLNGFHINNLESVDNLIQALRDIKNEMKKPNNKQTRNKT